MLVTPPVIGLFNHLKMFTDLHQRGTLTEHPITLTQLPYDLHRGVITTVHFVLLAHKGNLGLTKQLDQPAGARSRHASLVKDPAASPARC